MTDFDLRLPSGRLRAWAFGPSDGALVLGVPGLTATSREFAALGPVLAERGRRFVALDLRGRGHSDETGPGTYGWSAHAQDVVDAAAELGAEHVEMVGHSMGGFVGLQLAHDHPDKLGKLVLVDALGAPDPDALLPVAASMERLGAPSESVEAHIARARDGGHVRPWSQLWEDYYRYELTDAPGGGVVSRTSRDAVIEDATWAGSHPPVGFWPAVTGPALLVRATVAFGPEGGVIVTAADRDRFLAQQPQARAVDIDANHYGIIEHPDALEAIAGFLG